MCRSSQRQVCARQYIDGEGTGLHECGEHLKAPKLWNMCHHKGKQSSQAAVVLRLNNDALCTKVLRGSRCLGRERHLGSVGRVVSKLEAEEAGTKV